MIEPLMIPDLDIYRAAKLLIDQHGQDAQIRAAERSDELLEKGDTEGAAIWRNATNGLFVGFNVREEQVRTLMPDITPGQVLHRAALPRDPGSVQAIITRGWNAYLLQVVLVKNGETRMLVGKEVTSYAVAEAVARVTAAMHGLAWEKVEVVLK